LRQQQDRGPKAAHIFVFSNCNFHE
jgi:hypothetical protein